MFQQQRIELEAKSWKLTAALFVPVNNAPAIQIVRAQLHGYPIARQDTDKVLPHATGDMGQHLVLILEFYFEHRIRQRLEHRRHDLNRVFLRQSAVSVLPASRRLSFYSTCLSLL
jgi:hypothetical protein